ncbi:hypothetical protein FG382_20815 [Psychrobacillus lasiicapitis]|uniref:Uncharacterized protein n=1 Tax=Psychrobacillus lasiicapitis TaxID=1636719 RepID=A0A544SU48_9BACI|nr:hypothetical protein FG382_20815 [Psychrobacillus lasiicapitis]
MDCSERAATPTGPALVEDPGLSEVKEAAEATPVESVRPVAEIQWTLINSLPSLFPYNAYLLVIQCFAS